MASYSSYLKTFYKPDKVAQMDMDTTSDSQLGAQVTKQLKPGLQQNIKSRLQQTKQNASLYDADAASRGMGSSTWLTDVKNRNRNAEASDLSTLRANYNQNLYSNLQSLIQNRNSRNQTADNFNKSALNQAYATAQGLASQWAMYDKQNESSGGGGGSNAEKGLYWNTKTKNWEYTTKKNNNLDYNQFKAKKKKEAKNESRLGYITDSDR